MYSVTGFQVKFDKQKLTDAFSRKINGWKYIHEIVILQLIVFRGHGIPFMGSGTSWHFYKSVIHSASFDLY